MSQNKHQNRKNHKHGGNYQHRKHERIGFGIPAVVQIEQQPAVTVPLNEYEELIRMSERAEIVVRFIGNEKYPDRKTILNILGYSEEDGEDV